MESDWAHYDELKERQRHKAAMSRKFIGKRFIREDDDYVNEYLY